MSAATISINKKLDDGTLISVGGTSYDDFHANLLALTQDTRDTDEVLREMSQSLLPAASQFVDASVAIANGFGQTQTVPPATPPVTPIRTAAPAGETPPVCSHGMARTYREGTSASSGKPWKAWMCPMPKGQTCEPVWIR